MQTNPNLSPVSFHGTDLYVVAGPDGQPITPMKPIVEGMGLAWQAQHRKLVDPDGRWSTCITMMVMQMPGDDQMRQVTCLPLRKLPGWLMSIQPSRCSPEIRDRVVAYQNECDDVLWAHWSKQREPVEPFQPNLASAIQAEIARQVEAAVNAKLAAPKDTVNPDAPDTRTPVFSMTEGLQRHGSDLSAVLANKVMMACGWMDDHQHVSVSGKLVQYKTLVGDGLAFGANVTNYMHPETTTPYYYTDSFPQLLQLIEEHRHLAFDFGEKETSEMSKCERVEYKRSGEAERRNKERREQREAQRRDILRQQLMAEARNGGRWSDVSKNSSLARHFTSDERQALKAEFYALQNARRPLAP